MKHVLVICVFTLALSTFTTKAEAKEVKTAVVNCGAESVGCSAIVNAMGDPVMIDVSSLKITDLGTIAAEKKVDITLPTEVGTSTAYSLVPSTGESKGVETLVVFENLKQRPGSRLAGQAFIRIARHFKPIAPDSPWIEVGRIEVQGKKVEQRMVPVTFKTDGSAIWVDPATKEPEVFPITKKDLGQRKP